MFFLFMFFVNFIMFRENLVIFVCLKITSTLFYYLSRYNQWLMASKIIGFKYFFYS